MSTRRARIKAVATLPVRRKNTDLNDAKPKIPSSPKKTEEKCQNHNEPATEVSQTPTDPISIQTLPSPKVNKTEHLASETAVETLLKPEQTPSNQEKTTKSPSSLLSPPVRKSSPVIKYAGSAIPSSISSPLTNEQKSFSRALNNLPRIETNTVSITDSTNTRPRKPVNIEDLVFSPPSNSECTVNDVFDGIVPLKTTQNAKKPIDLLKNPITSDNVEVLFDPIVPLPSPSKVRQKLRPAPRLPHRRNSVQGSASESEDECRRALLGVCTTPAPPRQRHDSHNIQTALNKDVARVRCDSFSTSASQNTGQLWQSVPASPLRDKMSKARRNELSRRLSLIKRRKQMLRAVRDVKRQELTMYDLIFYNPLTNPIVPEKDDQVETVTGSVKEPSHEIVTETETVPVDEHGQTPEVDNELSTVEDDSSAPVPQIKLGPNGEIILDEQSLVIEQTESSRKLSDSVLRETAWTNQGRGRYSRGKRTADWTDAETVRFYRALASVGTDFTLMEPLFPGRNRKDLKFKFKKEERLNGGQVDKALRSQTQWDGTRLENVFAIERKDEVERAERERKDYLEQRKAEKDRLKQNRKEGFKISKASRAIATCVEEGFKVGPAPYTADAMIQRAKKSANKNLNQDDIMNKITQTQSPKPGLKTPFATLSVVNESSNRRRNDSVVSDLVTITPMSSQPTAVPSKIESGSLVVVTANDPNDPTKKVLQTYVSLNGKLTPVTLPSSLLTSVVGYMKKGTPSTQSSGSSPLLSPNSMGSQDNSRSSVIQINPTPSKRMRHDSFNITQL